MSAVSAGEFVGQLLHAVTVAHVLHLRTGSFSQHKALEELYEGLQDSVDEFAEAYQGSYGMIEDYPASLGMPELPRGPMLLPSAPVEWLATLSQFVQEGRKSMPQDSELQNLVDEIQGLIDRANYRLTFLS